MNQTMKKFFEELVEAPSPSGFEQAAQEVYRKFVKKYADKVETDVTGNVIALKQGSGKLRIMVVGHADEIGMMVNHIDENGYIHFLPIGGIDSSMLPGIRVNVYHGKNVYRGVIGRKPIHLLRDDERNKSTKFSDLWIDIGAKDKKDAEKMVEVGDFITFSPGLENLNNELVTTKATDNKAGVYVAAALLHALRNSKTSANVYAVSSVQEEVGLRGARTSAYGIDPHVGIAIDVTHATDYPGMDKNRLGDVKCGKGPVISVGANINPKVFQLLKEAGKQAKVSYQVEAAPRATGTDANIIQVTRAGVATGVVSIPNRYMHTPNEIISTKDLDEAVKLLAKFVELIDDDTDFIPKA
jgi:endoglucanase